MNMNMNNTQFASEQDYRLAMLNTLLRTPHRDVSAAVPLFKEVHERDPLFFGRLAAWYFDNGSVHDLKQLFIAILATSNFSDDYREAGLAMLEKLPPYQVERVVGFVKGRQVKGAYTAGVANTVPRSMRTAVANYLHDRERNQEAFDNVVMHARKPLKSLYASLRIKPGEYAQRVLFDNDPPEGSRLHVLKQLAKTEDPVEQARLIVTNKIPYRVAVSTITNMTPAVLVALVDSMTPQEVINNLSSLEKRGAMESMRKLIESKLEAAKNDKRVSALKTREALKAANLDEDMVAKVQAVGDVQIKNKARIKRPTAIFVDKSGSMEVAIEVGKQIAAVVAPVCEAGLFIYAFDTMAYEIRYAGVNLSDFEKAFKGIKAGGGTSCGVALEYMRRAKQLVEQIIIITDQEENTAPYLHSALAEYAKDMGSVPEVFIVNVGRYVRDYLEKSLIQNGYAVDTFTFNGDYYSLPSLLPMLAGGTRVELLMDIMQYPLPKRAKRTLAAV